MSEAAEAPAFEYPGSELALFEKAVNWKRYCRAQIAPFVHGSVLETGAGIGSNTKLLASLSYRSWTRLEPDAALAAQIELPTGRHRKITGAIADLFGSFDTIIYIDVLEHIEDHAAEMARAAARLNPGGHLIVLAPARAFLYAPFDAAVGHFGRYCLASLRRAAPTGLRRWFARLFREPAAAPAVDAHGTADSGLGPADDPDLPRHRSAFGSPSRKERAGHLATGGVRCDR